MLVVRAELEAYLPIEEPFVEGWEENQCFSLNSRPTALVIPKWF